MDNLSTGWKVTVCVAMFWVVWSWHFLIALMFLPTMVAFCRSRNWPVVFLVNVALGWTPCWVLILCYAIWSENAPARLPRNAVRVVVRTRML